MAAAVGSSMRRGGRGIKRQRKPGPTPRERRRRRISGVYQRWGSPTPPTPREVRRIIYKGDVAATQSARRRRNREATSAAFRFRKAKRQARWKRPGQGLELPAGPPKPPRTIGDTERRQAGMASRGPTSSLTPELAQVVTDMMAGGASTKEIAKAAGVSPPTVRRWTRTGRVAAVLETHPARTLERERN